jgi:hypothetical protein
MPGTLSVGALAPAQLARGVSLQVPVTISRGAGVEGPVAVSVTGLPDGVIAGSLVIPAGESEGTVALVAANNAVVGTRSAVVHVAAGDVGDETGLAVTVFPPGGTLDTGWANGGTAGVDGYYTGRIDVDAQGTLWSAVDGLDIEQLRHLYLLRLADGEGGFGTRDTGRAHANILGVLARPGGGWVVQWDASAQLLRAFDVSGVAIQDFGHADVVGGIRRGLARQGDRYLSIERVSASGFRLRRTTSTGALEADWGEVDEQHELVTLAARTEDTLVGGATLGEDPEAWLGKVDAAGHVSTLAGALGARLSVDALAVTAAGEPVIALADHDAATTATPLQVRKLSRTGQLLVSYDSVPTLVDPARGVVVMADGRVIVASERVIARFLPWGLLDPSFGTDGLVTVTGNILSIDDGPGGLFVAIKDTFDTGRVIKLVND